MTAALPPVHQCAPEAGRAHDAAWTARHLYPGPVGDLVHDTLRDWAYIGWRYDRAGRGPALMADIETRAHAQALGRTHP